MDRVEVEDIQFNSIIYDLIDNSYRQIKDSHFSPDNPLTPSYQRRLARLCKKLTNAIKLHSRQAPFDTSTIINQLPIIKPKILDQEQEPIQVDLALEVKELSNKCISMSSDIISKWKKLSEEMSLLAVSPAISSPPKSEPIPSVYQDFKAYKASCELAKTKMMEMVKTLIEAKKPMKNPMPLHPLERVAFIETNFLLLK
ncbi:unnamed protein product [Blepharisma stoltei]|uniref:Uncharacterized protein n=1 Tax=Blepharisma stoltei TaxID=1481888 RepID=A0AAU9K812_9CILI|nr:unnamed protein product [Blepharisma stoltei]